MEKMLKELCNAKAVSGQEENVADIIDKFVKGHVDETYKDRLGNLFLIKKGTEDGPTILVTAHMDEVGGIVRYIDNNGYIYFDAIGSHSPVQLVGARVLVSNDTLGIIQNKNVKEKDIKLEDLYIDVGASGKNDIINRNIGPGDFISKVPSYAKLFGKRRVSKAFDNRVGIYVMIEVIKKLDVFKGNVIAVASCQEEVGTRGAKVVSNTVDADFAFAIDVTFANDTPQRTHEKETNTRLGKGPAITLKDDGMLILPKMRSFIENVAKNNDLQIQYDISTGYTDANPIYTSKGGTQTAAILVPLRYMHSGNEIIDMDDVNDTIELVSCLISEAHAFSKTI